jgi:O-antigen ligase
MPFIALLATGLVILAFHKRISLTWKLGITGILLLVVSALALSPSMHSRFQEISDLKVSFEEGDLLSSTDLRVGVWRCDLTVIKDHFWSGVGAGNTRDVLEACYEGYSQVEFFEGEYNSHNQFAHFWLTGGVFSFIAFILYVLWLFRISWIHQNFPLFCFLIFFSLIIFTENYFSRQFGMMFWSFFVAIFALPERKV